MVNTSVVNQTEDANITEVNQPSSYCIRRCGFTEAVIRLVASVVVGVAAFAVLVYDIRSTRSELNQMKVTKYHFQTHGKKSDQQHEQGRRFSSRFAEAYW
ncbi:hypothetical protein QQF64_034543 [Cirrhinus molitorella]|uniref:Uncharacterized protein n=1 Tax=Cirrhinus molitorella TaxID=172907 RepID=A0ABR3L2F0_9TELE